MNALSHTAMLSLAVLTSLFLASLSVTSNAAVPDSLNYQAYLTNADGTAFDGNVTITFAAYNVDVGGVPLWSQTESVAVEQGLFSATLANPVNPFPAGLFDGPVYVGLFIAGEELLPRRALTSNAYAFKASDADTLDGVEASDLDQSGDVSALQGDVSAVQSEVGTLQLDVGNNDARITALEGSAGDITGVVAGRGLTGGGAAGDVALAIENNAVTAAMIADGNVTASKLAASSVGAAAIAIDGVTTTAIADGTILPADISPSQTFELAGVDVGAGGLSIDSGQDIIINDDFNGFRWRDSDGAVALGSITVREPEMTMTHDGQSNQIFRSNADGVGFAGALPTAGYAATVPSLNVVGVINMGYEIVVTDYTLSFSSGSCHSHGGLPCFYGSATVSCPTGKKVLGGGASGSTAVFGSIGFSQPSGTTGWSCGASYDIPDATRECFVICADVE